MKKILIFILSAAIFCGCSDDELEFRNLNVSLVDLIDCPNSAKENVFQCDKEDTIYSCSFITSHIRKLQNIESIKSGYQGDELYIWIYLDKDLFPAPPDRKTQVDFILYDIPKGEYKLKIYIDNIRLNVTPATWRFD